MTVSFVETSDTDSLSAVSGSLPDDTDMGPCLRRGDGVEAYFFFASNPCIANQRT